MTAFQDIVALLPGTPAVRHPLLGDAPDGVSYVDDPNPRWVAPELTPVGNGNEIEPGATSLIMISAPAAVGKTMLARALANETGGVLWNLAAFQVGSNFLAGTLSNAFGFQETINVTNGMSGGDFLIVMDALDEAAVKAGLANLEAFAEDLATALPKLQPPRPAVVILARAETAELAGIILEERGLSVAHYSIAYFDQARSEQFIDLKLDQSQASRHRSHRGPFEQVRGLLFSRLFTVLGLEPQAWEEPEARGFLGYAPVLEALAEYLDHPNYAVLENEINESFGAATQTDQPGIWRFLAAIVERVLTREQGKLKDNLPEDLRARLSEAGQLDTAYPPVEQCTRLVARALRQPPPDPGLPLELRDKYEESVGQMVDVHPFVGAAREEFANVVFGDYLYAHELVKGPEERRETIRSHLGDAAYRPSPLLAWFMLEMTPRSDGVLPIHAADFPILYESMRAEDAVDQSISLAVTEENGTLDVQVVSPAAGHLDVVVDAADGEPLQILRRLSNAQIALESVPVVLGQPGKSFTLGPNTSVRAPSLVVSSPDVVVETRSTPDGGVLLAVNSFSAEPDTHVTHAGPRRLELAVPHTLIYPWVQFQVTLAELAPGASHDVTRALDELAKLVVWFKSEGYGDLGMYARPLKALAAKGRISQELLDYSLDRGLITTDGKLYILHPAEFGLNLPQVKARVASDAVRTFLEAYVAQNAAL